MSVFSDLVYPTAYFLEAFDFVDSIYEENSSNTLIERTDKGAEVLLSCLDVKNLTVSQICNLAYLFSSTFTILLANSTPTVTL